MSQKLLSVKNTKCMPLPFQSHAVHGQIGVFAWPILAPDPYVWHPSSKVDTSLKLKMNSLIWVFLFVCFINHWKLSLLSGPAAHSSFTAQMGVPRPHFGNPCFLHYCSFLFFFFFNVITEQSFLKMLLSFISSHLGMSVQKLLKHLWVTH